MYRVLLGQIEPPDDATPDFVQEELAGVGNAAQQAMERGRFLKVSPSAGPTSALIDKSNGKTCQEVGTAFSSCCV